MVKTQRPDFYWITESDQLLLKAALLKSDDAVGAWDAWKEIFDPETINQESNRLLALVYHNLRHRVPEDKFLRMSRGVYQLTWVRNQLLFNAAEPVLRVLDENGIKILIHKGADLILNYYKDYGARASADFDILVPVEDKEKAANRLEEAGWKPLEIYDRDICLQQKHAINYVKSGQNIDLHWYLMWCCRDHGLMRDFWRDSVPCDFARVPARVLNPSDLLFEVVVHGARYGMSTYTWFLVPQIHWIPDALQIFSSSPSIDWDKFIMRSRKCNARLQVRDALIYLKEEWSAPVPSSAIGKATGGSTTAAELYHYTFTTIYDKRERLGSWSILRVMWGGYLFIFSVRNAEIFKELTQFQKVVGFFIYVRQRCGIRYLWQVPVYMIFGFFTGRLSSIFLRVID